MKTMNISSILPFSGVKTKKIISNETGDIILISIEKGHELAQHQSNTDASILILEGKILFKINNETHELITYDMYAFKKNELHALEALENAKVLLIK